MESPIEVENQGNSGRSLAAPMTRALELIAERCGSTLGPQEAWEAAAEGMASGRGDALQSLGLAARRAGLLISRPRRLDVGHDLGDPRGPALTWIPTSQGGRWLIVLGGRARKIEIALLDEDGEQRRTMSASQLEAWLEQAGAPGLWHWAEPLLPLVSVESRAIAGSASTPEIGAIRRLLALAALEREDLGVVFVYALAVGGMSLAVPVAVQAVVNTVAFGSMLQPLVVLSLLLALGLGFVAILRVLQAVVVEALQRRLFVRTAADFARRLPRMSAAARREVHGPELANRLFDVVTLQKAGASLLIDGLALVLQMVVGMALLAFYHPMLLAFDLVLLIAVVLVVAVGGRGAVATSLNESHHKYAVAAWIEDLAANPVRFADAHARAFADARAEVLIRAWLGARRRHFTRVLRQLSGGVGLQVLASTALLGLGGWLVIQRQLTLGQLVAAELVVTAIGAGLGKLGKHLESFYDASAAAAKLGKVVDTSIEVAGGELLGGQGPLGVVVRDLSSDSASVFELAPGEKLGVVGRTPAHSRLCDALFGIGGEAELDVRVDGCALRGLDLEAYRTEVGLVRGIELVAGPVRDNIDLRSTPSDAATIREVLDLVGLGERIAALPEGLLTHLLPSGAPLCEAEARRLMLAAALLRRPRLLVIDGGLDGLGIDTETRARLLDHLMADDAPWTLFVVSEDPGLLQRCARSSHTS